MRASLTASIAVVALQAAVAVTIAQQSRDADAPATPSSGTAVLAGTLVTGETSPRPIRRAEVRVVSTSGGSARIVGTDDDGRFTLEAMPAGRYALSATKPGYVQAFHGAKRPGRGPGVPVAIADGERVDVTLTMLAGAVISGVITDPRGYPASAVPVIAVAMNARQGGPGATAWRATSDDRGVYRIFGLPPGDYVVSANPRLVATSSIQSVTDDEIQWARSRAADGSVIGGIGPTGTMPPAGRPVTYAPVFYPGTTDANGAVAVSLGAGEERLDASFSLRIVPTARIAGTMVDQHGQAVQSATVTLHPRRRDQPTAADVLVSAGAMPLPRSVISAPAFSIAGVAPGDYTLVARTGVGGRGAAAATPAAPPLWNMTDITVDGWDQTDVMLRLVPGMTVSGSIAFERTTLDPPQDMSGIGVSMTSTGSIAGAPAAPRAAVTPAGAFRFASVMPGPYTLQVAPPVAPAGGRWTLKSAVVGGRDLADVLLDVKPGEDVAGVVITFTDRAAEIAGRLVDAGGRPVTQYSIVVFTVNRSLWLPDARRIRSTPRRRMAPSA